MLGTLLGDENNNSIIRIPRIPVFDSCSPENISGQPATGWRLPRRQHGGRAERAV